MVRVAVEALHQQDMDKLELGLSRLYQADPAVEVTSTYNTKLFVSASIRVGIFQGF